MKFGKKVYRRQRRVVFVNAGSLHTVVIHQMMAAAKVKQMTDLWQTGETTEPQPADADATRQWHMTSMMDCYRGRWIWVMRFAASGGSVGARYD